MNFGERNWEGDMWKVVGCTGKGKSVKIRRDLNPGCFSLQKLWSQLHSNVNGILGTRPICSYPLTFEVGRLYSN